MTFTYKPPDPGRCQYSCVFGRDENTPEVDTIAEKQNQPVELSFKASLKMDSQGSWVTCHGGLYLVRESDERLGLKELIEEHLTDSRGTFIALDPDQG